MIAPFACALAIVVAFVAPVGASDLRPEVQTFLVCLKGCKGGDIDCINRCEAHASGKSLSRVRCEADCDKYPNDLSYEKCKQSCGGLFK
jgi:hypothetical protein